MSEVVTTPDIADMSTRGRDSISSTHGPSSGQIAAAVNTIKEMLGPSGKLPLMSQQALQSEVVKKDISVLPTQEVSVDLATQSAQDATQLRPTIREKDRSFLRRLPRLVSVGNSKEPVSDFDVVTAPASYNLPSSGQIPPPPPPSLHGNPGLEGLTYEYNPYSVSTPPQTDVVTEPGRYRNNLPSSGEIPPPPLVESPSQDPYSKEPYSYQENPYLPNGYTLVKDVLIPDTTLDDPKEWKKFLEEVKRARKRQR